MNRVIITCAVTSVIAMSGLTARGQESKKTTEARKNVLVAQQDLREAKIDSAADFQAFKKEATIRIADNEKKISELKKKNETEKRENSEAYLSKVAVLQQKNDALRQRVIDADATETSKWYSFKQEFGRDMEDLGHSIKNFWVDND